MDGFTQKNSLVTHSFFHHFWGVLRMKSSFSETYCSLKPSYSVKVAVERPSVRRVAVRDTHTCSFMKSCWSKYNYRTIAGQWWDCDEMCWHNCRRRHFMPCQATFEQLYLNWKLMPWQIKSICAAKFLQVCRRKLLMVAKGLFGEDWFETMNHSFWKGLIPIPKRSL